jgi:hypothetical protein
MQILAKPYVQWVSLSLIHDCRLLRQLPIQTHVAMVMRKIKENSVGHFMHVI